MDEPSSPPDYVFDLPAEADYLDALRYYEDEGGLGAAFEAEIKAFDLLLWRKGDDDRPTVNSIGIRRAFKSRSSRDGVLAGWLSSCGIAMPAAGVQESFQRTSREINGETLYFEYDAYQVDGNHKARITIQNEPIISVE